MVAFPGLRGVLPGFGLQDPNDWGLGLEIRGRKAPHWTGARNSPRDRSGTSGAAGRSCGWIPDAGPRARVPHRPARSGRGPPRRGRRCPMACSRRSPATVTPDRRLRVPDRRAGQASASPQPRQRPDTDRCDRSTVKPRSARRAATSAAASASARSPRSARSRCSAGGRGPRRAGRGTPRVRRRRARGGRCPGPRARRASGRRSRGSSPGPRSGSARRAPRRSRGRRSGTAPRSGPAAAASSAGRARAGARARRPTGAAVAIGRGHGEDPVAAIDTKDRADASHYCNHLQQQARATRMHAPASPIARPSARPSPWTFARSPATAASTAVRLAPAMHAADRFLTVPVAVAVLGDHGGRARDRGPPRRTAPWTSDRSR